MNTQQHIGRMRILIDALFLSILSVPSYLYAATLYDYIDLSAQGCTWANWPLYVSQPGNNSAVLTLPENYSKVYLSYPTIFSPLGGIIAVNNTLAYWAPTAAPSWPLCKNWIQMDFAEYDITNIIHPGENIVYSSVSYLCTCYLASASFRIETDEGCGIIMKKVSGDGQKGDVCKTLTKPFAISVENSDGSPLQSDAGVGWTITNSPSGSNPRWAGEMIVPGDTNVIHKKYFGLGSIPGEYKAEASCSECTEGSPQEFTATAECPDVPVYRQTAYPNEPYDSICKDYEHLTASGKPGVKECTSPDDEPWSISAKGCALTSLAMVAGRYGSMAKPDEWDNFMTESGGYEDGAVAWTALTNTDAQIKTVLYRRSATPLSNSLMDTYLSECMPVIVKVINPNTGSWHWIVVTEKAGNEYLINDPGYTAGTALSAYSNKIYAIQVYEKNNGGCQ